jgi:transcription-repair coupling factor (superfamily II helicase)
MNAIVKEFIDNEKFKDCLGNIDKKISPINLLGLTDVAKTLSLAATKESSKRTICLITYNEIQAKKLLDDLKYFNSKTVYFPKKDIVTYDYIAESKDLPYERIEVLNRIYNGSVDIVVTTIEACMQKMISPKELYSNVIKFEFNKEYKFDEIKEKLVKLGYERTELIEGKGQFSVRGDIIDIAVTKNKGVRVEFWGDEIDSIRYFNISSQRSIEELNEITIYPAHEYIVTDSIENIVNNIKNKYEVAGADTMPANQEDIEQIKEGNFISKIDKYLTCFYSQTSNLLDYLKSNTIIFLDEIGKIKARADNIIKDSEMLVNTLTEKEKFIPEILQYLDKYENLDERISEYQNVYLEKQDIAFNRPNMYRFTFKELNFYKSSIDLLVNKTIESLSENKKVIILTGNEDNSKKIISLLGEKEIPHKYVENLNVPISNGIVIVSKGTLSSGFECFDNNLIVITSQELFSTEKKKRKSSSVFKQAEKVVFADLEIGDYVVHRTNGIGQFIGVNTIKTGDVTKDYIKIKYKGEDILYVPTNSLDNVRKYIGGGEAAPKLNRLGSKEWEHTKAKVKANLREVAKELIELYAKRKKAKGYAFSADSAWQKQFEDSFPYTETEDQLRCIEEVKKDMETSMPMDRLLCGDVGYGKTEVAIRAAFKAVMDQKQVAYLVPTTVLANQQYETFKERMKDFPIRVELLNRFKTQKEQKEIVKKLELGEIDVVIGTHRILSKDVIFKDLGLLIIDEEHRFGVKDKEKIKEIKTNVDVLTMTATPIPRTLHMSIVGIRDMSVIYEPPQNRKPVQTYVLEYDEEVIKEAITKELEKGGQVFYLFNNVEKIVAKAEQIADLVPEAKVEYAHGQMSGKELEEIMERFVAGEINVLVCTTILESGIDIPNANTIIVENANRLGLAQLYQIRGRVGRSNAQAYAYITYRRDKMLSEVADKRLKTIKEFTEFGSGFKIAMRDLEIRGAGSLLGEIQHGHMEQVGYDTYCNLLDEVVKNMQGIEVEEERDIQIDLNVSCYIPDTYIDVTAQKIEMYQNIALVKTEDDIADVIDEATDRYGTMPKEMENLIEIARIKMLCKEKNVFKITQKMSSVVFYFDPKLFNMEVVDTLVKEYKDNLRFSAGTEPYITLKLKNNDSKTILEEVKKFLRVI